MTAVCTGGPDCAQQPVVHLRQSDTLLLATFGDRARIDIAREPAGAVCVDHALDAMARRIEAGQ